MQYVRSLRTIALGAVLLSAATGCDAPSEPSLSVQADLDSVADNSQQLTASAPFASGARWIWNGTDSVDQWVAFRKTFSLSSAPSSAPTRIAVDTHYWLYLNGQLVTFEGGVKRGPNARDTYVDTVDIAPYLRSGQNTVAIQVWRLGRSGFSHQDSGAGGLLFQADVTMPGSSLQVVSDTSWRQTPFAGYVHDTAGTQPNFRLSEWNVYFDARNASAMTGWSDPAYNDAGWASAVDKGAPGVAPWNTLVPRGIPAYRFSQLTNYVNQASLPTAGSGGSVVAELPSNLQFTPYLSVDAPAGLVITMQTDHYYDGGEPNVRATYVTKGGVQEFEALGWMSGTKVAYTIPSGVKILALKYRESGYDTAFTGSFASNDEFFNSLWSKLRRTVYLNMRDTFMDCPTRERAPWSGDIAIDMEATPYMFDTRVNALISKSFTQLVGWQRSDGSLFSPYPAGDGMELPAQMLTTIASFARYYQYSGDASAFDESAYQAIKRYMLLWTLDSQGLINDRMGDWDWQDWGNNIDARVLENAWYVKALDATILLANLTGHSADVPSWQSRRDSISNNFDRVLWNGSLKEYRSPGYTGDTDDRANALAVSAGLAKPANYPDIANVLRAHHNASPYMETFVAEAQYLMRRASDAQDRMVTRYAPEVNSPGYTLWEVWTAGGSGSVWTSGGGGTDNHGWNGSPAMLSSYGVGLRPTAPGWTTYDALPQLGRLTRLSSTVPTPRGALQLSLDASVATRYTLSLNAPASTVGRIGLPRLATAPVVTANGVTVYQNGSATGSVSGLTYAGSDADYIYFRASAGSFSFVVSGSAPVTAATPSGWTGCAPEGGLCKFDGTARVRFGAGSTFTVATLSNGVACTSAAFGGDPTPNVLKHCDVELNPAAPAGYTFCSGENGTCAFTGAGKVAYGANGQFAKKDLNDGTACTNAVFGDPVNGVYKSCFWRSADLWSLCAVEGGTCTMASGKGVARYGANGAYIVKEVDASTPCTTAAFGSDPAPGVVKQCARSALPVDAGWTRCAGEGGTCAVTGTRTLAYGVPGAFVYRQVSAATACTNAAMGTDPAYGQAKACYLN
jgi:alpha-L-rhamnosidase